MTMLCSRCPRPLDRPSQRLCRACHAAARNVCCVCGGSAEFICSPCLKENLHYDRETGVFLWVGGMNVRTGERAGTTTFWGYRQIEICQQFFMAHHLAWFYVHGRWPAPEIDHRNGIRDDNRFDNLREATRSQQGANSKRSKANTSGFKGVIYRPHAKAFRAYITLNRRQRHLGYFPTAEMAHAAYCAAAERLFGEFARAA